MRRGHCFDLGSQKDIAIFLVETDDEKRWEKKAQQYKYNPLSLKMFF